MASATDDLEKCLRALYAEVPGPVAKDVGEYVRECFARRDQEVLSRLDDPELLEVLAAVEHERWSGWELYRELQAEDPENVERWSQQRVTLYADLEERYKESDRVEARKGLAIIKAWGGSSTSEENPTETTETP